MQRGWSLTHMPCRRAPKGSWKGRRMLGEAALAKRSFCTVGCRQPGELSCCSVLPAAACRTQHWVSTERVRATHPCSVAAKTNERSPPITVPRLREKGSHTMSGPYLSVPSFFSVFNMRRSKSTIQNLKINSRPPPHSLHPIETRIK